MVAPNDYAVTIIVNGVDVTAFVPLEKMSFEDHARQVSSLRFTIENPSGVTPTRAQAVLVVAKNLTGTPIIFSGLIIEVETSKRDNGITTDYQVEAADQKIRLQRSVLDFAEYAASDASILASLLSDAYPDLSTLFDFASDVTPFAADLALTVNNDSLLDMLAELADLAGATYRFDNPVGNGPVTFEDGDNPNYEIDSSDFDENHAVAAVGNPGNAAQATIASAGADPGSTNLSVKIVFGAPQTVTRVTLDCYANFTETDTWKAQVTGSDSGPIPYSKTFANGQKGAWQSADTTGDPDFPLADQDYVVVYVVQQTAGYNNLDFRLDNIVVYIDGASGNNDTNLVWDDTPDVADFNIDIGSGDEFAFDIDLTIGDYDDFNSITVIGGFGLVAIVWTYESDGDMDHINLETHVKSIAVFKNTNTDASPTWTAQTLGTWGTDERTVDGGSKDVLYDPDTHWLYFNSNPSNLSKSVRVTGNILIPIRVRMEDVASGDPTFATVYHDDSITSRDEAVAIGQAQLVRQNALRRLTFKTFNPGLKPGQSIRIQDSARGLDETLTIQRISTRWLGASGHAQFKIECGNEEPTNAAAIIAANDRRSRDNALPAATTTDTVNVYTDNSGDTLTDNSGDLLYEVV